jgi:hypothetical protein
MAVPGVRVKRVEQGQFDPLPPICQFASRSGRRDLRNAAIANLPAKDFSCESERSIDGVPADRLASQRTN